MANNITHTNIQQITKESFKKFNYLLCFCFLLPTFAETKNPLIPKNMDYKKAYEEALERAKAGKPMNEVFPELKESKDEKMVRIIENVICTNEGEVIAQKYGLKLTDLADWLERQKELNDEDKEDSDFIIYHPLKNGKGEYECFPYSFYGSLTSFSEDKDLIDFLRTCFYTEEECNEWIEKQKEQQPDTRDADDLQLLGFIYDLLNEIEWKDNWAMSKDECLRRLNDYRPQKPAEWSEEDEEIADEINAALRLSVEIDESALFPGSKHSVSEAMTWLKSLRPQSKQEWSEKDEAMANKLEYILRVNCVSPYIIKWVFEHLRPQPHTVSVENSTKFGNLEYERGVKDGIQSEKKRHWKPSEYTLSLVKKVADGEMLTGMEQMAMETLCDDLKKLM